jgi:hypothetical protein
MLEPLGSLTNVALGALLGAAIWLQLVLRETYKLPPFHTTERYIWLGRVARVLAMALSFGVLFVWAWQFGQRGQHWYWMFFFVAGGASVLALLRRSIVHVAKAIRPTLFPAQRRSAT